jgi:hypothetical protein
LQVDCCFCPCLCRHVPLLPLARGGSMFYCTYSRNWWLCFPRWDTVSQLSIIKYLTIRNDYDSIVVPIEFHILCQNSRQAINKYLFVLQAKFGLVLVIFREIGGIHFNRDGRRYRWWCWMATMAVNQRFRGSRRPSDMVSLVRRWLLFLYGRWSWIMECSLLCWLVRYLQIY